MLLKDNNLGGNASFDFSNIGPGQQQTGVGSAAFRNSGTNTIISSSDANFLCMYSCGGAVRDFSSLKRPAAHKSLKTRSFPGFVAPTIHISEIGSDQEQK